MPNAARAKTNTNAKPYVRTHVRKRKYTDLVNPTKESLIKQVYLSNIFHVFQFYTFLFVLPFSMAQIVL